MRRHKEVRKPVAESPVHSCSPLLILASAIAIISDLVPLIVVASTLFGFTLTAAANEIVTIAGNGTDGFSGDGGPALAAGIGGISGLAVDTAGNVYFADTWNQRVRVVASTGVMSTIAGNGAAVDAGDGGPAVSAALPWPSGLAVDANGTLYVSAGSRVRKFNAGGEIAAFAGTTTAGYAGDGGVATSARLTEPHGIAVDSAGNLYIGDDRSIRKVSPDGMIATLTACPVCGYATGAALALDSTGNLYAGGFFTPAGGISASYVAVFAK